MKIHDNFTGCVWFQIIKFWYPICLGPPNLLLWKSKPYKYDNHTYCGPFEPRIINPVRIHCPQPMKAYRFLANYKRA